MVMSHVMVMVPEYGTNDVICNGREAGPVMVPGDGKGKKGERRGVEGRGKRRRGEREGG